MGTSIFELHYLDDGSGNWGNPEEHHAVLEWHRAGDMFSYTRDGEEVFASMSIEEAQTLVNLFHAVPVRPTTIEDD
jgi:hypothetical protein